MMNDVRREIERAELKKQALAHLIMQYGNYEAYCLYVYRGMYQSARHTKYICRVMEQIDRGEIKKVIFELPPRHSKSMTISETFPSFFIGRDPNRRVIEVSYGDQLAQKFGKANKDKILDFGKSLFNIEIEKGNASKTNWGIEGFRGGMISSGIGGHITGEGADLLLIDDPIKNREEANSIVYREKIWAEWQNTLLTRLQPEAAIILILTRWHEDDLAGRILKSETADDWLVVNLPCIAEKDDLLGREEGEPLWAEFGFDLEWALNKKIEVGSYTWNALYQQRPSPEEGNIIKREWFRFYQSMDISEMEEVILSWDMSFKDKASSSYVVGQVWGRKGANKYLIDQVRRKMDFPSTQRAFEKMVRDYPAAGIKLIEDKANGPAIISSLQNIITGIIPVTPKGSKEARLHSVSPEIEAGNVFLPNMPWTEDFIEEVVSFPFAENDDQVDAMSQALERLKKPRQIKAVPRLY